MFSDRPRIHVQAGKGGDGGLSFRREKFVPKGGPDGGDGGDGGDVVLVADPALRDLSSLQRRRTIKAARGENGRGARKHGANGDDAEVRVPVGTQVFADDGGLIADLAHPGARVVLARGGRGGRGNARFVSSTRQVPRFAEVGPPGDERDVELHLKLLADAALVGLPNAGKSSLLAAHLEREPEGRRLPVHDAAAGARHRRRRPTGASWSSPTCPGLIEGASEGVGLGHEFLAHLERARTLVHVIDASSDADEQWRTIDAELAAYGAGLDERPQIVVLNKIDLAAGPVVPDRRPARDRRLPPLVRDRRRARRVSPRGCSRSSRSPSSPERGEDELADFLVYRPQPKTRPWRLLRTEGGFRVLGTPPSDEELERALRAAGAKHGATVEVGDEEFELA